MADGKKEAWETRVWFDVEGLPVRIVEEGKAECWDTKPPRPFPWLAAMDKGYPLTEEEFNKLVKEARR